jgi:hypothetical protein
MLAGESAISRAPSSDANGARSKANAKRLRRIAGRELINELPESDNKALRCGVGPAIMAKNATLFTRLGAIR